METLINYLGGTIVLGQDRADYKIKDSQPSDLRTAIELNKAQPCGLLLKFDSKSSFAIKVNSVSNLLLKPTLIVNTATGYECYYVIDHDDRDMAHQIFGKDFKMFSEFIAEIEGGEVITQGRLPDSYDYSNDKKIVCVFEKTKGEMFSLDHIKKLFNCMYIHQESSVEVHKFFKKISKVTLRAIEGLDFNDLVERLSDYPRDNEVIRMNHLGKLSFYNLKDGSNDIVDGYKYIDGKGMVYFLGGVDNDIISYPRGSILTFLYFYFARNTLSLGSFLSTEYGIILNNYLADLTKVDVINYAGAQIEFGEDGVSMTTIRNTENGPVPRTKKILHRHLEIFGKIFAEVVDTLRGIVTVEISYLCKDVGSGTEIILKPHASKKDFNKSFLSKGVTFYGTDEDISLFFEALFHSNDVPEIPCVDKNGFYDGFVVLGGKILFGNPTQHYHFAPSHGFELSEGEQVSCRDYLEELQKVYSPRVATIALLQSLALAGMNIRSLISVEQQIAPSLFISGSTGTGKTTLVSMIKKALGYGPKSRIMSCGSTTPQPIKIAATDQSILFLEEFTDSSVMAKEDLFRSIINREEGSRGMPGTNIKFVYRANLLASGEVLPSADSLINRFLAIYLKGEDAIGSYESINDINRFSISKHVYNNYINIDKQEFKKLYDYYRGFTIKLGYNSRVAEVRTPVFIMNKIHDVGLKDSVIVEYMKYFLTCIGFVETKEKKIDDSIYSGFKSIIFSGVMDRTCHINVQQYDDIAVAQIFFKSNFYNRNVGHINNLLEQSGLKFKVIGTEVRIKFDDKSFFSKLIDSLGRNPNINFTHPYGKGNDLEDY